MDTERSYVKLAWFGIQCEVVFERNAFNETKDKLFILRKYYL